MHLLIHADRMSSSNFIFRREPKALLWSKTWGSKKTESSPHINLDAFLLLATAACSEPDAIPRNKFKFFLLAYRIIKAETLIQMYYHII